MTSRPRERNDERAARRIVERTLRVRVCPYDDGSRPSMVDYEIHLPSGVAALEVISDRTEAARSQHTTLKKINHRLNIPGLAYAWRLFIDDTARIKDLEKRLAGGGWESGVVHDSGSRRIARDHPLRALGVTAAICLGQDSPGAVLLTPEFSGTGEHTGLATWVEEVLADQDDVADKLARHPSAEKHVFIWATDRSNIATQAALENRPQLDHHAAPSLPPGVTHVWVAGSTTSQGCLHWSPEPGWRRVPYDVTSKVHVYWHDASEDF